jgi:hypothetical protein
MGVRMAKLAIISLVTGVIAWSAEASSVIQAEVSELTAASDVVARGKVKKLESRWTADRHRIVTDVEIEVAETLKGSPERTVVIQQPGGVVGDIGQHVSGLASFEPNEEVVVFLEKTGPKYMVAGMAQGKYRVERSSDGRRAYAIPASNEARLIDRSTGEPVEARAQPLPLEALKLQVREAVKQAGQDTP